MLLSYFVFRIYMSEFAKAYSIFCFSCKNFFHRQVSFRFGFHLYMSEIGKAYTKKVSFFATVRPKAQRSPLPSEDNNGLWERKEGGVI